MASNENAALARRTKQAPGVVAPTTRVNLALPFSKITVEEPGKDLAELASIVAALAAVMERTVDDPRSCRSCASVPRPSRRGCAETPEV